MPKPHAVLMLLLALAFSQGCAATPADDGGVADQPTPQDLANMAEFDRFTGVLDGKSGTEVFNLLRDEGEVARKWAGFSADNPAPLAGKRLAGKAPANKRQLTEARNAYTTNLKRLRVIEKLAQPAPLELPKRRGEITIDGRADEPAWQHAAVVPINYQFKFTLSQPAPQNPSNVRALWDEQGLYLAYRIFDQTLHPGQNIRDDMTFLWDCIEVFMVVDADERYFWEVNVTPGGSFNDILSKKRARLWASEQDIAATVDGLKSGVSVFGTPDENDDVDDGYLLEVFIPWRGLTHLKAPPGVGSEMRGLFAYGDVGTPVGYPRLNFFSDVPMLVGYQDIWNYRVWKFVDKK